MNTKRNPHHYPMQPVNGIEMLEGRIAPASVITFTDVDGDTVIVKSSKGDLAGDLVLVDSGVGKQLTEIKLNQPEFQGTNLVIKVKKGSPGDGFVNVGYINAMGVDLGKIKVKGDIGRIDAGDGNSAKPAIKSIAAASIGAYGTTTQDPDGGGGGIIDIETIREILIQLVSTVSGTATGLLGTLQDQIGTLLSQGGIVDSTLTRLLTGLATDIETLLDLGADTINDASGGVQSLLANIASDIDHLLDEVDLNPGSLSDTLVSLLENVEGQVNEVVFHLTDPIGLGGTVDDALVNVESTINGLIELLGETIDASVPTNLLNALQDAVDDISNPGGLGGLLGGILGNGGPLDTLVSSITSTLDDLLGGTANSTSIQVLIGDLGELSASVTTALGTNLDTTTRNLLNAVQGAIDDILALPLALVNDLYSDLDDLLGSLTGQLPTNLPDGLSGLVDSINDLLGNITVDLNGILTNGGQIATTTLRDLALLQTQLVSLIGTIGTQLTGDVREIINIVITDIMDLIGTILDDDGGSGGGGGTPDPALQSNILGTVNKMTVSRDISNVFLNIVGGLKNLKVGGSLIGGASSNSGEIFTTGDIGKIAIKKSIIGGLNLNSGLIQSGGVIKNTKIGGSIIGGVGNSSGELLMTSDANSIKIKGDIIGNEGLFAASIDSTNGSVKNLKIGGSIVSGLNTDSGSIRVMGTVKNLSIKGNVIGDDDNAVFITAAAAKDGASKAFNKVSIGGRVAFANVLGGYDTDLNAVNAHAQIGNIIVKGNWIGSNLVAGAVSGDPEPENFGTNDDASIPGSIPGSLVSKIAKVMIKGAVIGTNEAGDNFGFVAQEIGKFKLGKNKQALSAGAGNDAIKVSQGTGSDVAIHEIGANLA